MNEKLHEALNQISDKHLEESARPRRHHGFWIGAVAAVLALVIALSALPGRPADPTGGQAAVSTSTEKPTSTNPTFTTAPSYLSKLVAAPQYPALVRYPDENNFSGSNWEDLYKEWRESHWSQYDQPDGYADSLTNFFADSIRLILSDSRNTVYSPINVYMALAMLAETTNGNSRQQILDLLGVASIEALRTQADHVWNAHYAADGRSDLLLANALWLDSAYTRQPQAASRLAELYYASVFQGDLGSDEMNEALRQWLNANTGGMLYDQVQNVAMDPQTVFALSSTVFFSAEWEAKFSKTKTEDGIFHAPNGDRTASFMKMSSFCELTYYWGSNFGAVLMNLTGGHHMWLILPDEGVTLEQVLASDEYLRLTLDPGNWENRAAGATVHLSLPKFDVSSDRDLIENMQALGVTDVFDSSVADFSPLVTAPNLAVSAFRHAARVAIDEDGVIGAAYTVIIGEGAMPPDGEVHFTLDRPFLFVVTSRDNLPIFTGTVMEP